jgi:uncharacterized protein YbjQ (UPF0145 family)
VHLEHRVAADELPGRAGMVEMDVREEEMPEVFELEPALREAAHQFGETDGRAAVEDRRALSGVEQVDADHALGRLVAEIDGFWSHASHLRTGVRPKEEEVLITTMNDIPGYEIDEVYGEVFGLTVRSRNLGSQLGAGFKSMVGGELKGMTKALVDSREQVIGRMTEAAEGKGANAIIAMRFDTSEMGGN